MQQCKYSLEENINLVNNLDGIRSLRLTNWWHTVLYSILLCHGKFQTIANKELSFSLCFWTPRN